MTKIFVLKKLLIEKRFLKGHNLIPTIQPLYVNSCRFCGYPEKECICEHNRILDLLSKIVEESGTDNCPKCNLGKPLICEECSKRRAFYKDLEDAKKMVKAFPIVIEYDGKEYGFAEVEHIEEMQNLLLNNKPLI